VAWEGPGFVDHHTHLLRVAAGVRPCYDLAQSGSIADWHREVAARGSTPMDEPPEPIQTDDLPASLEAGLSQAAQLGLVQLTEAGMREWAYFDALRDLRERGPLPVRVRILVASGAADIEVMRHTGDPWLEIEGVKFYADGWVGPRTCALCYPFDDRAGDSGILFMDGPTLARRAEPYALRGWRLATHAIGDKAIEAALDAYELIYGTGCRDAAPRIEHAQVLRPDLAERMAEMGVVACIQPSFAVSDAPAAWEALGDRMATAYRWSLLLDAGVRVIAGSDYPIEDLAPLAGLERLVTGQDSSGTKVAPIIDVVDALAMMTDPWAGVTVLSDDPHAVDPGDLHALEVVETRPAGS